ncbi:phage tail tape measure protein [Marinomonas primoryensis]|uniref:Phage tail tape measure protein n=1 Tax=Marinomonas primoryensis TaxID=178399 RepID=A0A2Z4PM20_9GAMM|nr:phage tail tape measure protein [Marinomonas primoryensis]AWX98565.1 phage tail tape measure protein [Marinomonas primoryensis]AWX98671.1 phage tail tape measure protein [Marinomonas primoryensis]
MAQKLETDIVINLAGNLAAKAKRYGNSMSDFARKNQRAMTLVRTTSAAAGRGIDRLGNRYVGLAATLATGAAVRGVGNFEEQMTRIGTNAKLSAEQVEALTRSVQDVSNQADVRIDTTQIAAGVDTLLGKTGDLKFTMDNLQNMGVFMQAFGADAESTGALFAQFREKGVKDAKEVMNVLDQLYGQFAVGSVSVKDLAGISEQLFATYQAKGPAAITQMGALVQLIAKSKGNANEALTSIQGIFATFSDKKKVEFLDKQGIKVFKDGTNELRQPVELLLEVLEKAKNDPLKLGDVFDQTSLQGLASLYSQDNKDLLLEMVSGTAELGATQKAAATNAATFNSAMASLNNSFDKFANEKLSGPIKELADAINGVDQETVDNWLAWGEAAAWALGGVVLAKKGLDAGMWAKRTFGVGGITGAKGKGGLNSLGATPVYVVNMGQGGLGGGTGVDAGGNQKGSGKTGGRGVVSNLLQGGIVAYGMSMVPDALPKMRRDENYDPNDLAASMPGLLDAYDGVKKMFRTRPSISELVKNLDGTQSNNQSTFATQLIQNIANPSGANGQSLNGQIGIDVQVSDDRVRATAKSRSPFISIDKDPDAGQN